MSPVFFNTRDTSLNEVKVSLTNSLIHLSLTAPTRAHGGPGSSLCRGVASSPLMVFVFWCSAQQVTLSSEVSPLSLHLRKPSVAH